MALYLYLKATPKAKNRSYLFPLILVGLGLVLLVNVSLPILLYQLKSDQFRSSLVAPVSGYSVDFTQPQNWFPEAPQLPSLPSKITHYKLSIPKLGIDQAVVEIGAEDLAKSLIHYSGTAMPGQYGNPVIFGHSVLPQLFNPENYKTIFSTLPKLKKGDKILIDFDGVKYRYQIIEMVETRPGDVSVLEQHFDAEYLTLVTCVPPGTYLRRLVIKAQLVPN